MIWIKAHFSDKLDQNLNVWGKIVPLALLKLLSRLTIIWVRNQHHKINGAWTCVWPDKPETNIYRVLSYAAWSCNENLHMVLQLEIVLTKWEPHRQLTAMYLPQHLHPTNCWARAGFWPDISDYGKTELYLATEAKDFLKRSHNLAISVLTHQIRAIAQFVHMPVSNKRYLLFINF